MLSPRTRPLLRAAAVLLSLQPVVSAQAEGAGDSNMADLITGLSFLTMNDEITGITATIDSLGPGNAPTELSIYKFPWKRDFDVGSPDGTLYTETVVSYLKAKDYVTGEVSTGPVSVAERWDSLGGMGGVGWTFPLSAHWKLRPSVSLALSYLRNDATFYGPGADELEDAISGTLVDFDTWAAIAMGTLTVIYERPLGEVDLHVQARSTWAGTRIFEASNALHEGNDTSRIFATRVDFSGDTPFELHDRAVRWSTFASYFHLFDIDEEQLGFDHAFEIGGGVDFPILKDLPAIGISGGILFGPDLEGYTIGLSLGA